MPLQWVMVITVVNPALKASLQNNRFDQSCQVARQPQIKNRYRVTSVFWHLQGWHDPEEKGVRPEQMQGRG